MTSLTHSILLLSIYFFRLTSNLYFTGGSNAKAQNAMQQRTQWYAPVLREVRKTMVSKMSKPKEVLVVENDVGKYFKSEESVHRVYGKHCSYRHSDFY